MTFDVIPQNLSISAMRSSGYRDTAHALAELIDNSVQSGQEASGPTTQVELICVDKASISGGRRRLDRIAVFDSAQGMDAATLRRALQFGNGDHLEGAKQKGIGKFGMGLPNSSISQCRRVDVWSWQDRTVHHTNLDVTEIETGIMSEVPEPAAATLPTEWLKMIASEVRDHGTLVVWSELDRVTWKQSGTLLRNTEFIAGRIYRRFIDNGGVRIRLAAYEDLGGKFSRTYESFVRPNDPLYLMRGTNSPAPYDKDPAFEPYGEPQKVVISFRGAEHLVAITASICKPETRREGGGRVIGKHAKRNQGISVVRSGRELELNRSFENSYDPRERWWGVQVDFDPALDDVFGVTNNKQSATGFVRRDLDDDAEEEGMSSQEYQHMLENDQDPRMPMYMISRSIDRVLDDMRAKIVTMREGERLVRAADTFETQAEKLATKSVGRRRKRIGDTGESDRQEEQPEGDRAAALSETFECDGVEPIKAKEIAVDYVRKSIKFRFRHGAVPNAAFFEVAPTGGVILISLNTNSPVHAALFRSMQEEGPTDPHLKDVLSLLAAWARMEDEAQSKVMLQTMQELRQTWGRIAMDFFDDEQH